MWPVKQIRRLLNKWAFKSNPLFRSMMLGFAGSPVWNDEDLSKLAKEGYKECYAVFACVKMIVDAAGAVPWNLFKRPLSTGAKKEKLEDHGLLRVMKRPNWQDGGAAFIKNTLAFYLISGNSYNITVGPNQGPPTEMYYSRPERMRVLPGDAFNPIRGYRYTVGGKPRKPDFKPEEVLHFKAFHPLDDWYGLSPIRVAARHIDIKRMNAEWNANLLKNDCRPPGAMIIEGNIEEEQREVLEEALTEKLTGYKNVGRPPVLEAGIKWQPFAITPRDMDHLKSDQMNMRKICAVFNVAPELIGDGENKTFSNYKEARKALYMENILPLLDYLRDEYNNWLTPQWGEERLFLEYDKDSIDALKEELNAIYDRMAKANWLTVNEKRIACGKDDLGPAGDVLMMPANLVLFSDISGNKTEE